MPFINGKYVPPTTNSLEPLNPQGASPFKNMLTSSVATGSGEYTPAYKNFNGYLDDYADYIESPSTTPLTTDFDEMRALNQGLGEKWGRSLGKFGVNAFSTAVDGTIGTVAGLVNMAAGGEGGFIDNPFSRALHDWSKEANENMAVYRSRGYENKSLAGQMFSAEGIGNFWGDTIFANAGYAVGALVPGAIGAKAFTALTKPLMRGYLKTIGSNLDEINAAIKAGTVDEFLATQVNAAKAVNRWNTGKQLMGALTASIGESRLEALETIDQTIQGLKTQGVWDKLKPEEQEEIKDDAANAVFATNLALLTASNFIQFGKTFSRGFEFNKLKYGLKLNDGKWVGDKAKFLLGKGIIKGALPEGAEEGSQYAISEGTRHYLSNRAKDPDATSTFDDLLNSITYGLGQINTKQGWENVMAGAIIGAGMPTFNNRKLGKDGKVKTGLNFAGNVRDYIKEGNMQNAANAAMAEKLNEENVKTKEAFKAKVGSQIEELRAAMGQPVTTESAQKIKDLRDGIIKHLSIERDMDKAIAQDDMFSFKLFEDQSMANAAYTYIKAGRLEEFKQLLKDSLSVTPEDLKAIYVEPVVNTDTGTEVGSIDNTIATSPEQMSEQHRASIQKKLKALDKVADYYNKVSLRTNNQLSSEAQADLVTMLYSQSRVDERIEDLKSKLNQVITPSTFTVQPESRKKKTIEGALNKQIDDINDRIENEVDILELINDLNDKDQKVRTAALQKFIDLIDSKAIEDAIEFKDGMTTKELARDINDLAKLTREKINLAKIINKAFNDPAKFNARTVEDVKPYPNDLLNKYLPYLQKFKENKEAIRVFEEMAEENISNNQNISELNVENENKEFEDNHSEITALAEELDENFDQTVFRDWTTFIRTTGNQDTAIQGSPEYVWYKWFLRNKNLGDYTYVTQTVDTIDPALKATLPFWVGDRYMTIDEIGTDEALLNEARKDVRIVVRDKKDYVTKDNFPVSISLSLPSYVYPASSPRSGEIRFATNKMYDYLISEEGLSPEEADKVIIEALEAAQKEYGVWLNQVKKQAVTLKISNRNPGARTPKGSFRSVVNTFVTTAEFNNDPNALDIRIESFAKTSDDKVKRATMIVDNKEYTVATGTSYIIQNGVPVRLNEENLSDKDVNRIVELLKYAATNPADVKVIEDHLKSFINMFANSKSGYAFYLFQPNGVFKGIRYGQGPAFITIEELLNNSSKVDDLKSFLYTKRYNINKKLLESSSTSSYTYLSIKNGSLDRKEYSKGYKEYLFDPNDTKFKVWGKELPTTPTGEIDMDAYIHNSDRVNPTLNFIESGKYMSKSKNTKPENKPKQEVENKPAEPSVAEIVIPTVDLPTVTTNEAVIEELGGSSESTTNVVDESVNTQKADIEKRRQEELKPLERWKAALNDESKAREVGTSLHDWNAGVKREIKKLEDKIAKYDAELVALENKSDNTNLIQNFDELLRQKVARLKIVENGEEVAFEEFDVSIENGKAQVAFIKKKVRNKNKGIGYRAYLELGKRLAAEGIILETQGQAQLSGGRSVWQQLVKEGYAKKIGTNHYEFILPQTNQRDINEEANDLFRLGTQANTNTGKGQNWFTKAFSNAVIISHFGPIDGIATAQVVSGARVLLSNLAGDRELFHEGFHLMTIHAPKEAKKAYDDLRKRLGDKIVTVQSGNKFIDKAGKNLTDREADEYLAYQFEDYMLNPDFKFPASTKSLFNKIYNFIQALLQYFNIHIKDFTNKQDIEKLFKFVSEAKSVQLADNKISNDYYRIGSLDSTQSNSILNHINYEFFRLLANPELDFAKFNTKEAQWLPSAATLYNFTTNTEGIYDRLKDKIKHDAESGSGLTKQRAEFLINRNLVDSAIEAHKEFISSYGLKTLEEIATSDENELSLYDTTNDVGIGKISMETNWKTRMPEAIKLLIASLPSVVENNGELTVDYKQASQVQFDRVTTIMQNTLAKKSDIAEMIETLKEKSKDYPYYNLITQALEEDNKAATKLRLDFFQFFSKNKQSVSKTYIDGQNITVIDAFQDIGATKTLDNWKQTVIQEGAWIEDVDSIFYVRIPAATIEDVGLNIDTAFDVLNNLGIVVDAETKDFIKSDPSYVKRFTENYRFFIQDIKKIAIKKEGLTVEQMFSLPSNRLKKLAELVSLGTEDLSEAMYRNSKGKTEYSISLNTNISNFVREFVKEIPQHLKPFKNGEGNPLTRNSAWQANHKVIKDKVIKGIESNTDGVSTTSADNPTFIVNYMNNVLIGIHPLHRSSVRQVEYAIEFPIDKNLALNADSFANKFLPFVKNELLAISLFHNANIGKSLVNYDKNGGVLREFDYLKLNLQEIIEAGKGLDDYQLDKSIEDYFTDSVKKEVIKQLKDWYVNEVEKNKKLFLVNNLATIGKAEDDVNYYTLSGFDSNVLENLGIVPTTQKVEKEGNNEITTNLYNENILNQILNVYTYNDLLNKHEMIINIFGDLSMFKNADAFNKRANLYTATRQNAINDDYSNELLDRDYPRFDGKTRTKTFKFFVISDLERKSRLISDGKYKSDMNIADAQSWVSPDGYRDLMLKSDPTNWSEAVEASWQHQAQLFGEHMVNKGLMTKEQYEKRFGEHLPDNYKLGNTYFNKVQIDETTLIPLNGQKPQGIGPLIHKSTGGLFVPQSIKTSVQMLNIKDYAADSPLIKLAEEMFVNQIDIVLTKSASKTSGLKPQTVISFDANGNTVYTPLNKEFIAELSWDNYGVQNQIENKYKEKTTYATQMRKQLINNLIGLFSPDKYTNTVTKYHNLTNLRTKKAMNALIDKLGLSGEKDYDKIKNRLIDAFKNKSVTKNELEGLALALSDRDVRKFDLSISKPKIENIIFSFFRSDVIMKKVKGDMFIQMSNAGTGIDLQTYIQVDNGNTIAAECAIPLPHAWYKWVLDNFGSLEKFNQEINKPNQKVIDPALLTFVANRIPCQAPNLIDVFRVKQFLHPFTGNKIILPEEHTTKTGSDFDVDKLISYLNNANIQNNKLVNIEYPTQLTAEYLTEEWNRITQNKNFNEALEEIKARELNIDQWIEEIDSIELEEDLFKPIGDNNAQIAKVLNRRNVDPTLFYLYYQNSDNKLSLDEFLEKYQDKPVEDYVSFEHIDNEINRVAKEIVLSPEYYNQLMTPTDEAADIVKTEIEKNVQSSKFTYSDLITLTHNFNKTRDARVAGAGIGIVANQQSSHVLTQQHPIRINAPVINKFYPSATEFWVGRALNTVDGKRISDIQSGLLTGFVDAENNPFILDSNIYESMLPVFNYLLRVSDGSPNSPNFSHLIKLFAQPTIKLYLQEIASSKGLYYDNIGKADSKKEVYEKITQLVGYQGMTTKVTNRSNDVETRQVPLYSLVEDVIAGDEDAIERVNTYLNSMPNLDSAFFKTLETDYTNQGYVLDLMLYYEQHARYLTQLERITRPDASFQKNRAGIKVIDAIKTNLFNSGYFDAQGIERLINNTFIKEFEAVRSTAYDSYSEFFITDNPYLHKKFTNMIAKMMMEVKSPSDIEASIELIENYFVTYVVNKLGKMPLEYEKIFQGNNTLAEEIYKLKKDEKLKNNLVIKSLYPRIKERHTRHKRTYTFDYIKFYNKKMDTFQTDAMVEAVMELYESSNPQLQDLAKKIVMHSVMSSGTQYTPDSYQNAVPNKIYYAIVQPAIKELNDNYLNSEENVDRVWQQFMWELRANRPLDNRVVTTTSYLTKNGKNKPSMTAAFTHPAFKEVKDLLIKQFGKDAEFALPVSNLHAPSEDGNTYVGMLKAYTRKGSKIAKLEPALWKYTNVDTAEGSPIFVRIPTQGEQNKVFEVQPSRITAPEQIKSKFAKQVTVAQAQVIPVVATPVVTQTNTTDSTEIVYNPEQRAAITAAINFINQGNPNEYFVIQGKAGTGKTFLAEQIVKDFKNKSVYVAALSHKAKSVIKTKFLEAKVKAKFYSLAGLVGQKMDLESGKFQRDDKDFTVPPIAYADIIIIDEASMINEEAISIIFKEKPKNAKVIFLGDIGQLPPIRTSSNPYYTNKPELLGKKSPVFNTTNKAELVTRVRQGEESPILPYADYFWNNSQVSEPVANPATVRQNTITSEGSLLFVDTFASIRDKVLDSFKIAVKEANPNHIKVVTYKNNTRQAINQFIHSSLFGQNAAEFNEGELIIFNNSYGEDIENATETQIKKVSDVQTDKNGIKYVVITAMIDDLEVDFPAVISESKAKYNEVVSAKFKEAFSKKGTKGYFKLLKDAWNYKNNFADIDYGYAITSHKSQGSTYDMVVVDERDILSVGPITNKEKSESIYTALTRARNVAIVISPTPVENVDFNLEQLNNKTTSNASDEQILDSLDFQLFNLANPTTSIEENLAYWKKCKM